MFDGNGGDFWDMVERLDAERITREEMELANRSDVRHKKEFRLYGVDLFGAKT